MKIEGATAAWNRHVETCNLNHRKHERHKIDLTKAYKFVGVTQFKFGLLPDDLKRRIKENILRGYSVTRNGNLYHWSRAVCAACPVETVHLGYICRQYMQLYVDLPSLSKARADFGGALQALCGVTGKVQSQHMEFGDYKGWLKVRGTGAWSEATDDGPRFKEVRLFVDTEMKKTLAKRQRVVAWFESGPTATIAFDATK